MIYNYEGQNIELGFTEYINGNTALIAMKANTNEVIEPVSENLCDRIPRNYIGIKDKYAQFLKDNNFIIKKVGIQYDPEEQRNISFYKLTDQAYEEAKSKIEWLYN